MQHYGTPGPSLLYDEGFFGRSELNFTENSEILAEPTINSALLGLSDSLDRLDTASSFCSLEEIHQSRTLNGASDLNLHVENPFGLDENGQLLMHEMLQQQQQVTCTPINGPTSGSGQPLASGDLTTPSSAVTSNSPSAWEDSIQYLHEMLVLQQQQQQQVHNKDQIYSSSLRGSGPAHGLCSYEVYKGDRGNCFSGATPTGESELLTLLQLPRTSSAVSSMQTSSSGGPVSVFPSNPGFRKSGPVNSCNIPGLYSYASTADRLSQIQVGVQNTPSPYTPPSLGSYFNSATPPNGLGSFSKGFLLRTGPAIIDLEQAHGRTSEENGNNKNPVCFLDSVSRRTESGSLSVKAMSTTEPRGMQHFATERQRREYLNEKYQTLRSLVPNPSKADRASIVADAIEYVQELKRTVTELKLLVDEKRQARSFDACRAKRQRTGDAVADGGLVEMGESSDSRTQISLPKGQKPSELPLSSSTNLRCSWLQRTSPHGTQVDVRIVHDEVNVRVTQRRVKGLLLRSLATFHELRLELQTASGSSIGEYDVYVFNMKILEGSSTFAGYILAKVLESVDKVF